METRTVAECEADVRRPGKFEGEPRYAPYFYDFLGDGGSDDTIYVYGSPHDLIKVTAEDRALFSELSDIECIHVWEDEQGFFFTEECSLAEWEDFAADNMDVTDDDERSNGPKRY